MLKQSLLTSQVVDDGKKIAVKADDIQQGSSIDWDKIYFEPQPGNTYLVKLLPVAEAELPTTTNIENRRSYKKLPDPERRGKNLMYISSNVSNTCAALETFFSLNDLKKSGDVLAEKKIKTYMSSSTENCVKIQVLDSPKREEIGIIRLMKFQAGGQNATFTNMIDAKLNPSEAKKKNGDIREDLFNIFGSSILCIECKKAVIDGEEVRDFTASSWLDKANQVKGAIGITKDGKTHQFSTADLVKGELKPEVMPFFEAFFEQLTDPAISMFRFFCYKPIDHPSNDEETVKYLTKNHEKVARVCKIILDAKNIEEIATSCKSDASPDARSEKQVKNESGKNVITDNVPDELKGSIVDSTTNTKETSKKDDSVAGSDPAADILNS